MDLSASEEGHYRSGPLRSYPSFALSISGQSSARRGSVAVEAIGLQTPADARVLAKLEEMDKKLNQIIAEISVVQTLIGDLNKKRDFRPRSKAQGRA